MIERINKRIDEIEFLNDEQKAEAKQKNEQLVSVNLKNAYLSLEEELKKITPTNTENLGIHFSPNGKEYYEEMLKAGVGTDMSVKEVKEYLQNKMLEIYEELTTLIQKNPDLANMTNLNDVKYQFYFLYYRNIRLFKNSNKYSFS